MNLFRKIKQFFLAFFRALFSPFRKKKQPEERMRLHQTKEGFRERLRHFLSASAAINDAFFDQLEEILISGDVGIDTTLMLIDRLKEETQELESKDFTELYNRLTFILEEILQDKPFEYEKDKLNVIFVTGVNGVGKTTTIAKLSNHFKQQGARVSIAACDTFRAAAIEQLSEWGDRIDIPVIKQSRGADPGAVLYDALDNALAKKVDILIVDTAGRLHNRTNLMKEVEKLNRIIEKKDAKRIQRNNFLVLDAQTGQNAYQQAEAFLSCIGVDGIILTKMDSTAKGGIVLPLAHKLKLPVKFIGMGEKLEDLKPFKNKDYINELLGINGSNPS